jgi:L-threonylcarbamoyladenylate synthase
LNKKPGNSKNKTHIRRIDSGFPDLTVIREAAAIIKGGGVVVYPTRNLYGMGADAFHQEAVRRIFHIKHRPEGNPVSILIKSRSELGLLVSEIPQLAETLMDRFWPGRLTLVFHARASIPGILTAGTGKIGVRVPAHPVAIALVNETGSPITGTSANLSGGPGCYDTGQLDQTLREGVDLVLDAGPLESGIGSTVLDVTTDPPTVIRVGSISIKVLFNL